MELKISYIKEALKDPINIGGLLLAGAAAAYSATTGFLEPTLVLAGALIAEGAYLVTVPASSLYRRLVDRRWVEHGIAGRLVRIDRASLGQVAG